MKNMPFPELKSFKDGQALNFNSKRDFLKTIFFKSVTTITRKAFGKSSLLLD